MKWAGPHKQANGINYGLIAEHAQTFNEGLFLSYCKLLINAFEKYVNFPFKV